MVKLAPGDPDYPPPCDLEAPVAFAVRLEGRSCPVGRAPVQLDDQPLLPPKAVRLDFEAVDVEEDIEVWARQLGVSQQGSEPGLELAAASASRTPAEPAQGRPDRHRPSLTGMSVQQLLELLDPEAMEIFRLSNGAFQALL